MSNRVCRAAEGPLPLGRLGPQVLAAHEGPQADRDLVPALDLRDVRPGRIYAGLIRWNLLVPDGTHMSADTYNKTFTAHGVIMCSSS